MLKLPRNLLHLNPTKILVVAFLFMIVIGGSLLSLPIATHSRESVGFLNGIFTATSALCVTGLVVVDTSSVWSTFGQIIILLLIQIGGLGVMTAATLAPMIIGHRFSLKDRLLMRESLGEEGLSGVVRLTKSVFILTFSFELLGAILLSFNFIPMYGVKKGIYFSIFHAISAFCNAGFDLISPTSLTEYVGDFTLLAPLMMLIVIGGLGFSVLLDLKNSIRHLSLHSKLVLLITTILIVSGTLFFFINEGNNPETLGTLSLSDKVEASLFQSITTRTAGFFSIDQGKLNPTSLVVTDILMFIGGSPGSTAGGIKTVTLGLLIFTMISVIRGREDVEIFSRSIRQGTVNRAITILMIAIVIVTLSIFIISAIEDYRLDQVSYEVISAFGTVGLSTGITAGLSPISKGVLIFCMYFGRVGPMTILFSMLRKTYNKGDLKYPEGRIYLN